MIAGAVQVEKHAQAHAVAKFLPIFSVSSLPRSRWRHCLPQLLPFAAFSAAAPVHLLPAAPAPLHHTYTRTNTHVHTTHVSNHQWPSSHRARDKDFNTGQRIRNREIRMWPGLACALPLAAALLCTRVNSTSNAPSSTLLVRGSGCFCPPADDVRDPAQGDARAAHRTHRQTRRGVNRVHAAHTGHLQAHLYGRSLSESGEHEASCMSAPIPAQTHRWI